MPNCQRLFVVPLCLAVMGEALACASSGAAVEGPSAAPPTDDVDVSDANQPAAAPTDTAETSIDFDEEVVQRDTAVEAQPRRDPIGSFELCGDMCRTELGLKKSFDEPPPAAPRSRKEQRRARRAERRKRRDER